ncbi:UNKNOWN [Stylonychia lemnae]|uniref:HMG box domain-containing protein n=1 Tax=Stylonychia lemnae TaxID=5949 RepID=A0A078AWM2_STYLE|nr:UNKNOWN [Stylonychia lemnae]|eukprot:CDW86559.1 UNKNOWN [Stylonychia lemnae]
MKLKELSTDPEKSKLPFWEKSKLCSKLWSELQPGDKAIYIQSAKLCKEQYVKDWSGQKLPLLRGGRGKSARDKTKPEPIMSPWRIFVKENTPILQNDNPDLEYYDIKRMLEDIWADLDEDQLKYYDEKSRDDKWRFLEEWEAWLRQRFASIVPIQPDKFPAPPKRPINGFKVFGEAQKTKFLDMMPESQQHEIAGLVNRIWHQLPTEIRQDFEEMAEPDRIRYRQQFKDYQDKYVNIFKRTDDQSKMFIEKIQCLQQQDIQKSDVPSTNCDDEEQQQSEIFHSISDQVIDQILNLEKDAVKLIKQSRVQQKEEQKRKISKLKPPKYKQRTIYSQLVEIQELQEIETAQKNQAQSENIEGTLKNRKYKKRVQKKLFAEHDDEEDYLLTHMAEIIRQNKKNQSRSSDKQPEQIIIEDLEKSEIQEQTNKVQINSEKINSDLEQEETEKETTNIQSPSILNLTLEKQLVFTDPLKLIDDQITNYTAEESKITAESQQIYENYCYSLDQEMELNDEQNQLNSKIDLADFFDGEFEKENDEDELMIIESIAIQENDTLKHKLKLKSKAVQIIQNKVQTKQDLEKIAQEIENLTEKNESLQQTVDNLLQENQVLGQIIDRMKQKVVSKSGVAVDELENAFIELNKEYEQLKNMNQFHWQVEQVKNQYEIEISQLRDSCMKLIQDGQEKEMRLNFVKEENIKLQDQNSQIKERCEFYKVKFMDEAKELIRVRDSFKQVVEDNKTHVQFIQVLEKRIKELETQAQSDIEKLHQRLNELRLRTIQETAIMLNNQSNNDVVNIQIIKVELEQEQRTNSDLKQQLQLLSQSKDQNQANLAMCRHNLLQTTMKLEEEVRRVFAIEKMRLEDLTEIENLKKRLQTSQQLQYQ